MIAISNRTEAQDAQQRFLDVLPKIRSVIRFMFRRRPRTHREELEALALAHAWIHVRPSRTSRKRSAAVSDGRSEIRRSGRPERQADRPRLQPPRVDERSRLRRGEDRKPRVPWGGRRAALERIARRTKGVPATRRCCCKTGHSRLAGNPSDPVPADRRDTGHRRAAISGGGPAGCFTCPDFPDPYATVAVVGGIPE